MEKKGTCQPEDTHILNHYDKVNIYGISTELQGESTNPQQEVLIHHIFIIIYSGG